jgi:MFS family permease
VRGLLALVAAVVLVDTASFAVLSPLLPWYAATFGLSKAATGVLAGAFAAGVLASALPSGVLAARIGLRPTLVLGLSLTAGASLLFGVGQEVTTLLLARVAAGVGSACSWTAAVGWLAREAPPERRGELIGFTVSAAVGGALLGPVVGAAAARVGTGWAFGGVALACVVLAWRVAGRPAPKRDPADAAVLRGLREPRVRPGLLLILLAPLLFGVLGVLVPLRLGALGWTAVQLGGLYVTAAGMEAMVHPLLGRWADRTGPLAPVSVGLIASAAILLGLANVRDGYLVAGLVVLAAVSFGATLVPGMALLAHTADSAGLGSVVAIALANLAWALGHAVGAPAGGWLGERFGDAPTYIALAGTCLAALAGVRFGVSLDT